MKFAANEGLLKGVALPRTSVIIALVTIGGGCEDRKAAQQGEIPPQRVAGSRPSTMPTDPKVVGKNVPEDPTDSGYVPAASIQVSASSTMKPFGAYTFGPSNLLDGDLGTSWQPAHQDAALGAAWFRLEFAGDLSLESIGVANGFQKQDSTLGDLFIANSRVRRAEIVLGTGDPVDVSLDPNARGYTSISLDGRRTTFLEFRIIASEKGGRWNDVAISEVRVTQRQSAAPRPNPPAVASTPSTGEQASHRAGALGGGYKNAKWGMSEAEVKASLGAAVKRATKGEVKDTTAVEFDLGSGKSILCWFYRDGFFRADYDPNLLDEDTEGAAGVLHALAAKFGEGHRETGLQNRIGIPLVVFGWFDGTTRIRYTQMDPDAFKGTAVHGTASSVKVVYVSQGITEAVEQADSRRQAEEVRSKILEGAKNVEGDL